MKRMRDFKVNPGAEHAYEASPGGLCRHCGGNNDMLGHVLARRRAAGKDAAGAFLQDRYSHFAPGAFGPIACGPEPTGYNSGTLKTPVPRLVSCPACQAAMAPSYAGPEPVAMRAEALEARYRPIARG